MTHHFSDPRNIAFARALGRVMRSKRLAAGLSGDQLAEASGSYRNHYYELETGKHQARLSRIESVAQVFGLRASDLVREAEALLDAERAAARAA